MKQNRTHLLLALVLTVVMTLACDSLHGQSAVQFDGAQVVTGSGFSQPMGAAADANNNFYIADTGNNRVVQITAAGAQSDWIGASTQISGTALKAPQAVAVDGAGNVYVADAGNNRIVERNNAGLYSVVACCATLTPGSVHPVGIAADASGDLWIADSLNQRVIEITSQGAQSVVGCCSSLQPANIVPAGLAMDSNGNLYIADAGNNRVVEIASTGTQTELISNTASIAGTTLKNPLGVAIDASGNLYIADTGNSRVVKMTAAGAFSTIGSGFNQPAGIAVDGNGNVQIADTGNNRDMQVETQAVQFGMASLCPAGPNMSATCSQSLTLNYSFTGSVTLGAPVALLGGVRNQDYSVASGGTCVQGQMYAAGDTCTLQIQFAPMQAGVRNGAVELTDSAGTVQSSVFASGIGGAPQIDFDPGQINSFYCCNNLPSGYGDYYSSLVLDGAGDIYLADVYNKRVVKHNFSSGNATVIGTGINSPEGLAVDGAGDVYIADLSNNLYKVTPTGTQTTIACCANLVPNTLNAPISLAIDSAGNLYVADEMNNRILKYTPAGIWSEFISASAMYAGASLNRPTSIALDTAGNLYIADLDNSRILEVSPSGRMIRAISKLPDAFYLAVDAAANIYISIPNDYNGFLVEITPGGDGFILFAGNFPSALTVDGAGNIYVYGVVAVNGVAYIQRTAFPGIAFANTAIGISSTDSPQSVLVQNTGTLPLELSGLTVSTNFALGTGSGDCTSSVQLSPGGNCALPISFTPTVSTITAGQVTLTDNSGNYPGSVQSIPLSGTALAEPGKPTVTATITPATLSVPAGGGGTATLSIIGQNGFAGKLTLACTGLPSGATCTFSQPTPTITGPAAVSDTLTFLLASSSPAVIMRYGNPINPSLAFAGLLGCFGFCFKKWRRPRTVRLLLILPIFLWTGFILAGLAGLAGCGGGGSSSNQYTVSVTATSPVSPGTQYTLGSFQLTVQ